MRKGTVLKQRYQIIAPLGEGGMGIVYQALDLQTHELVAIKTLPPNVAQQEVQINSVSGTRRILREAESLRQLEHPNIVRLRDAFLHDERYYLVLEYVDGFTLSQLIRNTGAITPDRAANIAQQVCLALAAAHTCGIIHRDVKSSNIMQTKAGAIKLADFDIARGTGTPGATTTGMILGTAEYMSPEQARGEKLDARTDIYSLGIVLYEMLTGRLPFQAENAPAILYKHVYEKPVRPTLINTQIPSALERTVLKALAKNPNERFANAEEFERALGKSLAQNVGTDAISATRMTNVVDQSKRGGLPIFLAGGVSALVIMLLIIAFLIQLSSSPSAVPTQAALVTNTIVPTQPLFTSTMFPIAATTVATDSTVVSVLPTVISLATLTKTATRTLIATLTPTPSQTFTHTATQTLSPTATQLPPTSTSTPTTEPTLKPSLTPMPATATMTKRPVTQTPRPNTTTPVSSFIYPPPIPFDPPNDSNLSRSTILRWNSTHGLLANQVYDVLVWPEGTTPTSIGTTQDTKFSIEFSTWGYPSSGKFFWQIRVRQIGGAYLSTGVTPLAFTVSEGNSPGGGQGGDNEPPPPPDPTEPNPTKCPKTGC